jgi:hypothetical protein
MNCFIFFDFAKSYRKQPCSEKYNNPDQIDFSNIRNVFGEKHVGCNNEVHMNEIDKGTMSSANGKNG